MEKQVKEHYNKAVEIALENVEKMARNILRRHKHIDYFVMAMGTYYFVDKNGNIVDTHTEVYRNGGYSHDDAKAYFKPLNDFIGRWNEYLKLTGNPMKLTAKGKIITDW